MGKPIIKLGEYYLEWSSVVDAPVTFGMSLEDFKEYYRMMYGEQGMRGLDERLARVATKGTSDFADPDVEATISGNRAGPDEARLTQEEIFITYCLRKPLKDWGGWIAP